VNPDGAVNMTISGRRKQNFGCRIKCWSVDFIADRISTDDLAILTVDNGHDAAAATKKKPAINFVKRKA
jgi:hypothetical protein